LKSMMKAVACGFAVWAIPFVFAIMIFPIRISDRPLFESIMPVVVTLSVVSFSVLYLGNVQSGFLKESIILGLVWLAISILLDLLMFMPESPMNMNFVDYMKDIGLTYVIIPTITIGLGYLSEKK